jgi:aryl-phospho-beta-D-glucosidase BglC (GH1 family)
MRLNMNKTCAWLGAILLGAALCGADETAPAQVPLTAPRLLPAGPLFTKGSQIVDQGGNPVRIASIGLTGINVVGGRLQLADPFGGCAGTVSNMVKLGFNTVRVDWIDKTLNDARAMAQLDEFVAAAGKVGLRVIFDNHNNEATSANWTNAAQQINGLWFDTGPGTDGTDGTGTKGTISDAQFQADWVAFAQHWKGNLTVIGYDIRNEPTTGSHNGINWGNGGPVDIHAMYERVGQAIQAVDPNPLIICEGFQNWSVHPPLSDGDLTRAGSIPVKLTVANKLVYSVHSYPQEIGGTPNSGDEAVAKWNREWGYLISQNIAPVWIGEMGDDCISAEGQSWARTIITYMNGLDGKLGGPTFSGTQQGISGNWWLWGYLPGQNPVPGILKADGSADDRQKTIWSQMLFRSK